MTPRSKKIFLITLLVIIITTTGTVYFLWNKPHKNVKDADAENINAKELYDHFIADSAGANALYSGKIVKVTGVISQASVNHQSQQVILLKTTVEGGSVNCTLEEKIPVANPGDTITIKGICSGYISGDPEMGLPGDVFIIRGYQSKLKYIP